jgi:hypothetical protein
MLAHLGVTLADLQADPGPGLPTVGEYLPRVVAAAGPGARRTYGSYWNCMAAAWGERTLDAVAASDIEAMQRQMAATARSRRNSRSGRHAGEHVIAAAQAIYNRAIADGLIDAAASPAHRVVKPRRLPSTRRALVAHELEQINRAARTSGNDVVLDALLLRLHTETGTGVIGKAGEAAVHTGLTAAAPYGYRIPALQGAAWSRGATCPSDLALPVGLPWRRSPPRRSHP